MSQFLDDLRWRGLIAQTTDEKELAAALEKPITLYIGFDPTAPSIHVGNLVVLLVLRRFQLAGHHPIALVGGATGLVGDPSGRNEERSLNSSEIVDFKVAANPAVVVNNLDWTSPLSAIEFLRDIGKHFSVNQMLSKDSVANRLEGGISYTEFSYQVLQAFDYLELYRRNKCTLQLGGSDQWGNIVAGLDLIRRVEGGSGHALTVPLLTKADGTKFGKTAGGSVWLDPEMTSPYAFFQYWLNSDDKDVINFLKVFSFKSRQEIEEIEKEHNENPGARNAHRALARELTSLIHGTETSARVEEAAKALFGQGDLTTLDEKTLASALSELPRVQISASDEIPTWVDLLAAAGVVDSKSAARRIVKEGGAYLNNEKISGEDFRLEKTHFLCGKYAVLRKGKRDLAAVELA
jgi:tyrosyl-tRNA synthetase